MFKKLLIPLLFLSFSLFLFCNSGNDAGTIEITLNVPANANLLKSLRQSLPQFTEQSGIKVRLIPFSGQEKLYAMMSAGSPPDIFYTNSVIKDRLAAEGRLLDLNTIAAGDSILNIINPIYLKRGQSIDNGWYQFCDWTFTYGFYYNKTLFEKYNVPLPDSSWTWADMLDKAQKLTKDLDNDGKTDQYGVFIARHFISAFEQMNGAYQQANPLFFSVPKEAAEVQQKYMDLMNKYQVMPSLAFTQAQGMQFSQMLNTGKVAMIVEAVPNLDFIQSLTIDWDVAPIPRFKNKKPSYFRSASGGLSVSSSCEHPKEAWQTIKWLVTKSEYNTPNPILSNNFVDAYENKYPELAKKNFRQVWELSEKYDGGDKRNFVRYSSWTSQTILEQLGPKMDMYYAGKLELADIINSEQEINKMVLKELDFFLANPGLKPEFRQKIQEQLKTEQIPQ